MKTINLDYAAATPVDPAVLEAMLPYFTEHYGNPSSGHTLGEAPRKAIEKSRQQVAALIGAEARDIIFTATASEANNLAIKGAIERSKSKGNHIISSEIEHFSILNQLKTLKKQGFEITLLPVDNTGLIDPEALKKAITEQTILISIQAANPEIGTVQPLERLAAIARE